MQQSIPRKRLLDAVLLRLRESPVVALLGARQVEKQHYHGQTWNATELGRSMSASPGAVNHYRDILAGTFMVRVLQPWHENLGKRQVKAPKIFLRDSGLPHHFLGITERLPDEKRIFDLVRVARVGRIRGSLSKRLDPRMPIPARENFDRALDSGNE